MATGFVDRIKGKITQDPQTFWIGGTPQYGAVATQAVTASSTVAAQNVNSYGITTINASTGNLCVFRLQKPGFAGQFKTIQLNPCSSVGGIFLTASTDGSITFNGSSFSVIKSTIAGSIIELTATSTNNWATAGLVNSSATHTLSTTT